jgi:uncharacterized protein involved in outer membrane biogenesis
MGRIGKITVGLVVVLGVIVIAGFYVLPPLMKPWAVEKLAGVLKRDVAVERIRLNPFRLSCTVEGVMIREPAQTDPFVSFDGLYVNVGGLSSLFHRALVLEEVRLTRPYVHIARKPDRTYNFSDLIPREKEPPEPEKKPFRFSLNNIALVDGSVDFDDRPMNNRHTVPGMNLGLPFLSITEVHVNHDVEPRLEALVNGDTLVLAGKSKVFHKSKESHFTLNVRDLDLPHYLNYVPVKLNGTLVSAVLDTNLDIAFVMPEDQSPALRLGGDVTLRNVAFDDPRGAAVIRLPSLRVDLAAVEPLVPDIHLAKVMLQSPEIAVRRDGNGRINLLNLTRTPEKPAKREAPKAEEKAAQPAGKPALKLRIDEVAVEAAKLSFRDETPAQTADIRVAPLDLRVANLSTEKGATGTVDLRLTVERQGTVTVAGPFGIEPLRADLALDVKKLAIRTFQPYFADKIRIHVAGGTLSLAGNVNLSRERNRDPRATYAGKIYVSNLATLDQTHANRFVNWKQLYFEGVRAGVNPFFTNIRGISLTDYYARIIINPDGTLNLTNILAGEKKETAGGAPAEPKPAPAAQAKTAPAKAAMDIKIGKVTVQGGTIDFSDRFIQPNYSVKMLRMGGSVTGLSTDQASRAAVDLKGNLGRGSPVEIAGKINPLIKDPFVDMKLHFKDIELSPMTPYSGKFIGHPIEKGKLTFDVAYRIDQRKLDAQNKVFFDQLTFGDRVDSPTAIKVPVTLAVALLKDRKGEIHLDIPISGSLDDPKFRVWPVIWQVIVNLITKAATAPFALLSALMGGGEELSFLEFDAGSARITETGRDKLKALAKALYDRPGLRMDIEGYVDVDQDREGLKKAELNRKLRVQKLNDLIARGQSATLRDIGIEPGEYEKYLALAYRVETFPKPRTAVGVTKGLPPAEMEKLILTNIAISDGDLKALAARRASTVKDALLGSGEIPPERIFIVEPQSLAPRKQEKQKDSRVDFKLK